YNSDRYSHFEVSFEQTALASGNISAINTPDMIFSDLKIEANPPFRLQDLVPKESAESVFVIEGNVESNFMNIDRPLFFGSRQHNLQYNTEFAGTHTIHSPRFHVCTITYHKAFLNNLLESDPTGALASFCRHLQRETIFLGVSDAIHLQQRIADLIQVIRSCPFTGVTRYIFTESKLLELFVLQMDQFHAI